MQSSPPSQGRFATLDLLRLAAALSVVAFHYLFRGAAGEPMMATAFPEVAGLAIHGYLGVHLFFVISGFVIAWSAEGRDWQSFAVARFARLYPAFLLCMTATFVLLLALDDPRLPVGWAQYAANLVLLSPAFGQPFMDGVYWSIVLEIVFYGWVALALLFGVFERWKLPLVAGWLALCAANEFWLGSGGLRLLFVTEYGPWFASGIVLQHMLRHGRSAEASMLLAASFALSCAMLPAGRDWMLVHYGEAVPLGRLVALNAVLHALAILAAVRPHAIRATPPVLALGGLTYPLYLLHQNVGYALIDRIAPEFGRWTAAAVVAGGMLAASFLVWRFYEPPARRVAAAAAGRLLSWTSGVVERLRLRARGVDAAFIES